MPVDLLALFALAVLPLSLTPGASSALAVSRVLAGGTGEGRKVALGTATGLYVHATTAAVGLAAVVMASSTAFTVLKIAGAAYLIGIGLHALVQRPSRAKRRRLPWSDHGSYVQALLANVLNPKAAGVYLTLLPQFVDPTRPVVPQIYLLASVHAAVALTCLTLLSHAVARTSRLVARPGWRAWVQRATGAVLVCLGIRTLAA